MALVARMAGSGDTVFTTHPICIVPGVIMTLTGSSDVFVAGHGVHRNLDLNTPHTHCPPVYSTPIVTSSPTVFANGNGLARVGDVYSCSAVVLAVTQSTVYSG
jgi:uncharacterized Zn-binding protein involved in type VI secretion